MIGPDDDPPTDYQSLADAIDAIHQRQREERERFMAAGNERSLRQAAVDLATLGTSKAALVSALNEARRYYYRTGSSNLAVCRALTPTDVTMQLIEAAEAYLGYQPTETPDESD